MKKILILLLFTVVTVSAAYGQGRIEAYDQYIEQFKSAAIANRDSFGIPASITLAQGLLESSAGKSLLATKCNNHFGIKCGSSWYGETMKKDDDSAQECFRCYTDAAESYRDHSNFLKKQRYAFLFDYDVTRYDEWARGLSKAGYATDPAYPNKLITLIETYQLYLLDNGKDLQQSNVTPVVITTSAPTGTGEEKIKKEEKKVSKPANNENVATTATGKTISTKLHTYNIIEINGVRCIQLTADDNLKNLSKATNISVERLCYNNDLSSPRKLEAGEYVYLSYKKSSTRAKDSHTVKAGESMHSISQMYGIRMSSLYRLNGLVYGTACYVGQTLKLHR